MKTEQTFIFGIITMVVLIIAGFAFFAGGDLPANNLNQRAMNEYNSCSHEARKMYRKETVTDMLKVCQDNLERQIKLFATYPELKTEVKPTPAKPKETKDFKLW